MNCPKCGKTMKDGAQFCPYCGFKNNTYAKVKADSYSPQAQRGFVQPPAPQPVNKPPKKSGKKLVIAVVAVVLALAVAGASVFFLFFNKGENNDITAATSVIRTVRGRVNAEAVQLDTAKGLSLAVYAVTIDPETGKATVSSEPVAKTVTDENGEYEFELAPGNYIVQTEDNDAPTYRRSFIVPEEKETSSGDESEKKEPLEIEKLVTETGSGFDTGFKCGDFVAYNGIAYYTDKIGLHRDNGSKTVLLDDRKCGFLATDGETVYYTVFNEHKKNDGTHGLGEYDQYDMYSIGADGENKEKVFSCEEDGKPVLVANGKLYYFEIGYMGDSELHSYDFDSGERKKLSEGVRPEITVINNRIIMRGFATDVSNRKLFYYDVTSEKLVDTNMEVLGFYEAGDKLYLTQFFEYHSGNMSNSTEKVSYCNVDDISESGAHLIVDLGKKFVNCVDENNIYYTKDNEYGDTEYCRYSITDETEEGVLTDVEYGYSMHNHKNGVVFIPQGDHFYYLDNNSDTPVRYRTEGYMDGRFRGIVGEYVYTGEYDDGLVIRRVKILDSTEKSNVKDWERLYIELLEKGDFDETVDSTENDGYTYASLEYIDSDDVPELIVASASTAPGYRMYWVKDGVLKGFDLQAVNGMGYAEKGGLISSGSMHQGIIHWGNYSFDGNEVERVLYGVYIPETGDTPESYEINGEEVSKEEYDSIRNEYKTDKTVSLDCSIDEMITRLKKGTY